MDRINILITIDQNYIAPFKIMLCSFLANNPGEHAVTCYLIHSSISETDLNELHGYCRRHRTRLVPLKVETSLFTDAPSNKRYPQEMYYRLLAPLILPPALDRILYLDPDILVINPVRPLWETDLCGNAFAAAAHTGITDFTNDLNQVRLGTDHDYYNSGVILIDLAKARELVRADEIFQCVKDYQPRLMLPDQDVFNIMYGKYTLAVEDVIWNYDVRNYSDYLFLSSGEHDLNWMMKHTAILHFCGSSKPWKASYAKRFGVLYKHYMNIAARDDG